MYKIDRNEKVGGILILLQIILSMILFYQIRNTHIYIVGNFSKLQYIILTLNMFNKWDGKFSTKNNIDQKSIEKIPLFW